MNLKRYGSADHIALPRSTPIKQCVSTAAIQNFIRQIEEDELELHSLIMVRNGHVVAEGQWAPYELEASHLLNSLSKSFTSTAIGMAIAEGLLSLDDSVISFFPEEVTPTIQANMSSLRVRHLLTMSTGHAVDTTPFMVGTDNWAKAFLEIPITHEPGTFFLYNTGATYMLSAILRKATGENLLDFLQPRLIEPLGMSGITSVTCPRGIHVGGFGMSMKTEDIAKFGLLYLQKGQWNGQRILSEKWVEEATASQIANGTDPNSDWAQGYGFQFWRCRHGAYRGDGAFGQFCIVLPEQNTVIAMTGGVMEMQSVLDVVWEHLLPGLQSGPANQDPKQQEHLGEMLNSLAYPLPSSKPSSPEAWKWSGKSYKVGPNEAGITEISFDFSGEDVVFSFRDREGEQLIRIRKEGWSENTIRIAGTVMRAKATGGWRMKNKWVMTLRFVETPFCDTWTCHFVNDSVKVSVERNVWVMPGLSTDGLLPELTGYQFADRDMWIGNGMGREEALSDFQDRSCHR